MCKVFSKFEWRASGIGKRMIFSSSFFFKKKSKERWNLLTFSNVVLAMVVLAWVGGRETKEGIWLAGWLAGCGFLTSFYCLIVILHY